MYLFMMKYIYPQCVNYCESSCLLNVIYPAQQDPKRSYCSKQLLERISTHWGRETHICVGKLIIIGSDNGLSSDRRQAIIWTNAPRLLSIVPLRTYFNENLIKIQQFSLKKMHVKLSSAKWRPSCLGLNMLTWTWVNRQYGSKLPSRLFCKIHIVADKFDTDTMLICQHY